LQTELLERHAEGVVSGDPNGSSSHHRLSRHTSAAHYRRIVGDFPEEKTSRRMAVDCAAAHARARSAQGRTVGRIHSQPLIREVYAMEYAMGQVKEVLARLDGQRDLDCMNEKMETLGGSGIAQW
jgi:hypothetical protein